MRLVLVPLLLAACVEPGAPQDERALSSLGLVDDRAVTPEGTRYVAATFSPDGAWLAVSAAGHDAIDVVSVRDDEGVGPGSGCVQVVDLAAGRAAVSRLVAGER